MKSTSDALFDILDVANELVDRESTRLNPNDGPVCGYDYRKFEVKQRERSERLTRAVESLRAYLSGLPDPMQSSALPVPSKPDRDGNGSFAMDPGPPEIPVETEPDRDGNRQLPLPI